MRIGQLATTASLALLPAVAVAAKPVKPKMMPPHVVVCVLTPGRERYGVKVKVRWRVGTGTHAQCRPRCVTYSPPPLKLHVYPSLLQVKWVKHQVRVGSQYCDPSSAERVVAVFLKAVRFNELTQLIEVDPAVCTQHAAATCFVYEKRTMIRKELPVVRVIHEALEARNKRIVAKRVKERMGGAAAATAARAGAAHSLSQGQSPALNADDWAGLLADCEAGQSQLATDGSLSSEDER